LGHAHLRQSHGGRIAGIQHLGALEELDQEFFRYPENLSELLFAYVATHPELFGEVEAG
jgi:Domain of unknown function (DUF4375)